MDEQKQLTLNINSHSEFPSLSSAQPQQAAWVLATQRATSQASGQRPQGQGGLTNQHPSSQAPSSLAQAPQPYQQQQQRDGSLSSASQFISGLDDPRLDSIQNAVGQPPGTFQPKTGSIDEFPPLGSANQDRREDMLRTLELGGPTNGNGITQNQSHLQGIQSRGDLFPPGTGLREASRQLGLNGGMPTSMGLDAAGITCPYFVLALSNLEANCILATLTSRSPFDINRQGQAVNDYGRNVNMLITVPSCSG